MSNMLTAHAAAIEKLREHVADREVQSTAALERIEAKIEKLPCVMPHCPTADRERTP